MLQAIANLGGWLLMMGQHDRSETLFYYFRIEDQVPENHLLRLIDKHISFEFVREQLRDSYSETGRPSIDPKLLLRILLIGYLYGTAIRKSDVIDLTSKMHPDGTLDWTPLEGKWLVLRFGYSLLGITNHPATPEATGLEVDKLDRRFVKDYFEKYLDRYKETVGADEMGKKGIRYVINDSWEAGSQNWTDNMLAHFRTLRGYDATPWLPVLTGRIVESAEASDRFLWDFRKTIADLIANEHYGQLEETLHERGMGHYGESHESGRAFVADGMEVKKFNEVPMSE